MSLYSLLPKVVLGVGVGFVANAIQIVGLDAGKTMTWLGYGLNTTP